MKMDNQEKKEFEPELEDLALEYWYEEMSYYHSEEETGELFDKE